jgi:beta-mannosidase
MKYHQRSSIGNATIEEYMAREFKNPKDFESLLYLSQLLQADGIQTAIEAHRRNKATCMGSLYWQLNDCWPGASWSSIDYYGKWKALHYKVRDAFKPVIVSHEFLDSNLQIAVISDLKDNFYGVVEVTCFPFKGDTILKKWTKKIVLKPFEANVVLSILKNQIPPMSYLEIELKKRGKKISSKNVYLQPYKELDIANPELDLETKIEQFENKISVTIKSKYFAKGVWISSNSENNFSDNFFDLPILGEKTVSLEIKEHEDVYQIIKSLKLKSLWDTF